MDGGDGAKKVVYNTKEDSKKRGTEKEIQERKREQNVEKNPTVKRKSSSLSIILTGHVRGCFLYVCMCDSFHLTLYINLFILDSD